MKRTVIAAALLAALVSATSGTAAVAAPPAPDVTAVAQGAAMVKAIVVLKAQVDPSTVRAPSRRQRQVALVRALRARATTGQTGVLDLLRKRRAQGLVAEAVPLWVINAVAVTATPSVLGELAQRADVRQIDPDRIVQAPAPMAALMAEDGMSVEPNVDAVNAPAMWNLGFSGQGVVVATMDTGVDGSHPDLAASWRGGTNSWYDPNGEHPTVPTDVNGHGTSTMGVIVGGSAGGTSIGVAPGAKWIAVKIFNDRGSATTSRIHQGYQWLLDPDRNPATADAPDVVNNSWTGAAGGCVLEFQPDLRNLRAAGVVPVFSAGNYGPGASTVLSPANLPEALAVGSVDDAGVIDPSSSRGPSTCDQRIVPALVAPGVGVRTTDLYGGYLDASGTSLAAPHVAGALALLLNAFPELIADRQQSALESAAVAVGTGGPDNAYGHGRLDALAAYNWLSTTPDFTVGVSPAEATTAPGGSVTYTVSVAGVNGFTGDVALALSGLPGAHAGWTITPSIVTGGAGTAQITVVTAPSIAPGSFPLTITATSAGLSRTAAARLVVTPPPDFALAATPSSRSAVVGSAATYTVAVTGTNGFAGTVGWSVAGLPSNVGTASFSPPTVTGSGSTTLTITTAASAPTGTYALTVTGTSGAISHTAGVTLVVTPAPDFSLTASPTYVSVLRRQAATYTVSSTPVGGFADTIALSLTGAPSGTSVSFTPNPVAASGSSTLRVTTNYQTPRGTFTLRINGTRGALTHQVTVTLVVR
jgi:subtilisin family serine protease